MSSPQNHLKGMDLASEIAWEKLAQDDLESLAERCGASLSPSTNTVSLPYLTIETSVIPSKKLIRSHPGPLTKMEQVLILRYLCECKGLRPERHWISFRELPGGAHYLGPFRGRTAAPLVARFGTSKQDFAHIAGTWGGKPLEYGDSSFLFQVLPFLWVVLVLHVGDEEFPPEVNILFDGNVRHQYSTEDCAAAAQVLARRLTQTP